MDPHVPGVEIITKAEKKIDCRLCYRTVLAPRIFYWR